jgi:cytoskeletal protein CcmA (bactofilin family)
MFTRRPSAGSSSLPGRTQASSNQPQTVLNPATPRHLDPPPPEPSAQKPVVEDGHEGIVVIGKGTRLIGDISDCMRAEVRGVVEGNVVAKTVTVFFGGGLKGSIQADSAEIHGVVEGNVVVRELLDVHATARMLGEFTYGRLSVAPGGQVGGSLRNDAPVLEKPPPEPDPPAEPAAAPISLDDEHRSAHDLNGQEPA